HEVEAQRQQHQGDHDTDDHQHELAVEDRERRHLDQYHDENPCSYKLFHAMLRKSTSTRRSASTAISRCPSFITCGENRASSNSSTSRVAGAARSAWWETARASTSDGVSQSRGTAPGTCVSSRSIAASHAMIASRGSRLRSPISARPTSAARATDSAAPAWAGASGNQRSDAHDSAP